MVDSSFLLWLSLYITSILLLVEGNNKKKVVYLIGATILFSVISMYSFSFTTIIGDSGTWVMIGVSMMGLIASLINSLKVVVNILKESTEEIKEVSEL